MAIHPLQDGLCRDFIALMASLNNNPVSKQPKILLVDDREDNLLSIEAILGPTVPIHPGLFRSTGIEDIAE
jgi:hypothetical protein